MPNPAYGGKSADTFRNQYIGMTALKNAIAELVERGELVKVAKARQSAVSLGFSNAGYVPTDLLEEGMAALVEESRVKRNAELRDQALRIVGGRHAEEVDAVFKDLLASERERPADIGGRPGRGGRRTSLVTPFCACLQ